MSRGVHQLPIVRDTEEEFSGDCCPRPGGFKELHKIHRTLPTAPKNTSAQDVLQDEDGFAILTVDGDSILDNLKA